MAAMSLHHSGNEAYQVEAWGRSNDGRTWTKSGLEGELKPDLGGEGDADCGTRTEEIAESAGGDEQLLSTCDWHGARWIRTKSGDVREIVHGNGESADIADVVVAGIVAIEEVEKFDEGREGPTLVELDGTAHAQIGLNIRRAAEFVESGLHAVDHRAIAGRSSQRDRPRGFCLREQGHVETSRSVNRSR